MSAFNDSEMTAAARVVGADPLVAARVAEAGAAAPAVHSFGLVRVGPTVVALPVAALREVIPCPALLAPLPMTAPGLLGTVQLRGTVIPVLDLRPILGMDVVDTAEPVIVVLRWDGRLLGLRADGVSGMARVAAAQLHGLTVLTPAGRPNPATHSFQLGDGIATLLDAERIAALPGVPMVLEPPAQAGSRAGGQREPVLLFRVGGLPFGIAAMSVDATVPRCELQANALNGGLCHGVIDHHGHEVPVVDTLALLGLGRTANTGASAVLVLRFGADRIGLMLDEVSDIATIAVVDILPLPALALRRAALFRGVLVGAATEQHLLLDARALQADAILRGLASMSRPLGAARPDAAAGARHGGHARVAGTSYVTYDIGIEAASPLVQLSEILPYPPHATPLTDGHDGVVGLFTHRGVAVPLVCLCTLLGRPAPLDKETARVLLVQDGAGAIGLVVTALRSIEAVQWEQPPGAPGDDATTLAGVRRHQPLVEVGAGAQRRTLPRLDLPQLVRALRREYGATPGRNPAEEAVASASTG